MGPKSKHKNLDTKEKHQLTPIKHINQRKKDSYLADDQNFTLFSKQLEKLGLELRDITGDGNCLFRALSDQINGNETQHIKYRRDVCDFMRKNREDFEPFVVALSDELDDNDDIDNKKKKKKKNETSGDCFESYVHNLEQLGTHGGNDCLVAFSRMLNIEINIHQLNQAIWKIENSSNDFINKATRQIHLSYHNGDHYSSVRRFGDETLTPANVHIHNIPCNSLQENINKLKQNAKANKNNYAFNYDYDLKDQEESEANTEVCDMNNDNVEKIINITNCYDLSLINESLKENDNNLDMSVTSLLAKLNVSAHNDNNDLETATVNKSSIKHKKLSSRDRKQEKKNRRKMDRQRLKISEEKEDTCKMQKNEDNVEQLNIIQRALLTTNI